MFKTTPIEDILPESMDPLAVPYMSFYADAIHELACFGTHIMAWSLQKGERNFADRNELDLAVPLLFRHILELIDSIAIQIRIGAVMPSRLQLRALLEAQLSLEYALEKDRRRRAACFLVVDHYRKLNLYKQFIAGSPEFNKLSADMRENGMYMRDIKPIAGAKEMVQNQLELVSKPIYNEARNEYLVETKNNKTNLDLKWYSLFEGPSSVKWLAKRLKKAELYEFQYKPLSNPIHGTDLTTNVIVRADPALGKGNGAIIQLRNVEEAYSLVSTTIAFVLLIYTDLMGKQVVSEHKKEIGEWGLRFKHHYRDAIELDRLTFNK